jgi:glycosyltransferase involved in cell wall biosynthesis
MSTRRKIENKKILQVSRIYPPSYSGYGRQLASVNNVLVKNHQSYQINIITAFDGFRFDRKEIQIHGFWNKSRSEVIFEKKLLVLFYFTFFIRYIKYFYKNDLIHVISAGPEAFFSVVLSKIFRKKIIIKVIQSEYNSEIRPKLYIRLKRYVLRYSDHFIAISQKIAEDLKRDGVNSNKIVRIPNSVDTERFRPILQKKNALFREYVGREKKNKEVVFVFLGAICKRKGIELFIEAVSNLSPKIPATFILAGPDKADIPNFSEKIELVNSNNSMLNVLYIGEQPCPEDILRMSDCLILPSYFEGMPNVVLEAMASGLAIIASDIPVHREIVDSNFGYLFKKNNSESLKKAISSIMLLKDDDLRQMGKEARKKSLHCYCIEKIACRYSELYQQRHNFSGQQDQILRANNISLLFAQKLNFDE